MSTDDLIFWLREYAASRINSQLTDERRSIPPYIILDFGNRGLLGLQVQKQFGGLGLSQTDTVRVLEQVGAIDLTLATFLSTHANGVHTIQRYGCLSLQEELLPKFAAGREISAFALTEPCAGSNPQAIETRAVKIDQRGWVLNGEKYLVDSGSWASVITVFARTSGQETNLPNLSAFAVRQGAPGLVLGGEALTMGLRGMVQNALTLRDVHVAPESLLGEVGAGNAIIQDTLSLARLNLAAKSIGGMKRCLQLMQRYASRRLIATGILWNNPVTRSRVNQLVSAVTAVEALVRRIAIALDLGEAVPTEAFLACKVAGSEYLWKAADTLVQVLGGRGYVETNIAPQILRDARSFLLSEGPTETLLMYLGSRALEVDAELERFIAVALGAPRIAGQLREIAKSVRVRRASEAAVENTAQSNRTYWTSWLMGEVAMWAILAAAVENDDISGHGMARAWVRTQLDKHIAALTNTRSEEIALSSGAAEAELIASYSASIGDIEQNMPAAVQEIDRYLIRDKAAVSVPVPHITGGDRQSYPKDVCIHHLFEQQVAQTPERLAVACAGEMLSYRELDSRADSLARKLREAGIGCGALVGLCVERSVDLLVSLLGILKAGAAYVPLDATHPSRRLAQILEETQMSVIVAHAHLAVRLPHHGGQIITPELVDVVNGAERKDTRPNADPNQLAYIMYTSGSTGAPKGVAVEHRSVVNFLCSMKKRPGFTADDVLVAVTPISFDIAGLELLLPVVAGGRVVLATRATALDGVALTKLMDECGATVLQATPAMWQMLIASGWQGRRSLKALCGGESLSRELARSIQSRTASLWNLYGPTETTIWSCIEKVSDEPGPVSIGRPIANTQVYILNQEFAPVPAGLSGEIFIGGDGVAQGYWQRPELTAERFLPDPFSEGGRIYRTGDLARHLPDGRIEYLGRLDHQVKIRGLRVELGEIEAALKSHDHVRQAVVVAHTYSPDDVRLIAYVIVSSQLPKHSLIEALQSHIRDRVPTYMLPSAFVVLDRLPLTANGKIDRNSLPLPRSEDIVERHEDPSASDVERKIKKIWSKVLGVPTPHREDDFFVLGGHSLLATQVISQLRQSFGIELPIAAIFERPTVAALTETVQAALDGVAEETTAPAIRTTEEIDVSSTQQRLWFLNQLDPKSAQYHVPVAFRLAGSLQVETLRNALQQLVERHDALRARFESRDGRPVQIVEHSAAVSLPVVDLVSIAETTRQAELTRLIREEATRPFDLSAGPLLRVLLLQLAADHYVLLLTAHHIVADGWSMELLLRELGLAYTALASGRGVALDPLAIRYGVYLEQQHRALRGPVIESQLAFWRKHLADLPLLDLPTDCVGRREESDRGATLSFAFSAELSQALLRIGRRQGATTFVTLMAALQTFLRRHTGQDDFGIGFPIANRPSREVENLVGCFVNTLVLRADLSDDPPFTELLARVRSRALEAYAHQAAPYESLVQEFRRPLFRVMLALQNAPAANLNLPGMQIAPIETGTATAKFDLTFSVREFEGKLLGNVDYRTDLFEAVTIERMLGRFQMLVQGIVADPEQRISQLPLLMNDEKRRLLVEWNDTTRDCPKTECIHELFEAQAQRTPDAVAVVFEDHQLTYKELNERANQVAHYLRRQGVGPEVLVAICMERSLEMIIGLLGILKAGGAYVPLDPEYPKERLALMLADTQASVLLTQQLLVEDSGLKIDNPYPLSSIIDPRIQVICLDRDWPEIGKEPPENGESGAKAENLAYVIYTSGSTGKPKGVLITHHNVTRLFESTYPSFHFNQNDVWTLFHSYTFDFSVWEIWGALLHGGRLVIVSYWVSRSPELFYDLLRTNNVTVLNQTPSAFHQLMQADKSWQGSQDLALRWIVFGGEPLNVQSLKPWFDRHGDQNPRLVNMYGITETTVHVTYCPIEAQDVAESIGNCIGKQIPDLEIHILDQNRNLVPIGIPGELYVGGAGVARGYLNRPELTAERFVQDPFGRDPAARLYRTGDRARYLPDGNIEFLGRTDSQVKVRGYRVELGEIEAVLAQHPAIQQAVVLAREDGDGGDKRLVAYVVTEASRPSTKELRDFLKQKLPDYMVPAAFVILGAMPLSANGKLDRKALPAPDQSRADLEHGFVAPRTPTEDILANIWVEVLKLDAVGVHDNFFELGGHSLLATRVVSRIRNALNCDLPLRTLFETPTLAGLAQSIQPGNESPSVQSWVPALRSNDIPLSFAQQRLWFLDRLDPDRATYNVPAGIRLRGELNITALEQSLNEVIRRHEGLRTVFPTIHDNPAQKILPSLVLSLTPIDLGEYRENEREAALQTLLQQEAEQPFDLASGPLIRARLWHLGAHDHVLFLNLHHIVSDGWSMGLLFRELSVLYRAYRSGEPNPLAELPIQYADYAIWQRNRLQGENLDKQVSYWKTKLDGITTLQLAIDHPRPAMETHRGSSQTAELSAQLSKAIKAIGQREGVTLFMTLLAAFQALLSRYTGQEDIAVGSPIAGRTCQETEGLIGFFVNTLVLRADLSGNPTFKELLRQVRETNLEAYTHQDLPFEKLVEELQPERNTSISPLFQVMFILQNAGDFSLELAGISAVAIRPATRTAKFDLMLTITEREGALDATLNYNADLFQAATIERMLGHFQTLLEGIVHDPDQRISDMPLLTQAEKHQLLEEWNDTEPRIPQGKVHSSAFRSPGREDARRHRRGLRGATAHVPTAKQACQ